MEDGAPLVDPELREEILMVGMDHDGEVRSIDPDLLGLMVRPLAEENAAPMTYLRTKSYDRDGRALFVHSDMVHRSDLDPILRRIIR